MDKSPLITTYRHPYIELIVNDGKLALNWTLIENQEVGRLPMLYR